MTGPVVRFGSRSGASIFLRFLGELFWLAPVGVLRHSAIIKPVAVTSGELPSLLLCDCVGVTLGTGVTGRSATVLNCRWLWGY